MNPVMSTLNYICDTHTLINIVGNSSSNNVLLTLHALPLRGRFAPCIPASEKHTRTQPCNAWRGGKKINQEMKIAVLIRSAHTAGP